MGGLGIILQKALCEKLRMLPRGKLIAGDTRAMGSFCESAREAKGRTQRAMADILAGEVYNWEGRENNSSREEEKEEEERVVGREEGQEVVIPMASAQSFPTDKQRQALLISPPTSRSETRENSSLRRDEERSRVRHPRRPLAAMLYELIAIVSALGLSLVFTWLILIHRRSVRAASMRSESTFSFHPPSFVLFPEPAANTICLEIEQLSLTIYQNCP